MCVKKERNVEIESEKFLTLYLKERKTEKEIGRNVERKKERERNKEKVIQRERELEEGGVRERER